MDFNRYFQFYDASDARLEFGRDWGVYQFPDGQNQIWFACNPIYEQVCLNHPAIVDLMLQTRSAVGPLDLFVAYLYGARSDKPSSGERTVPNVASAMRSLLENASHGKRLEILVPHDSQSHAVQTRALPDLSAYDGLVFPDSSASRRYPWLQTSKLPVVVFEKVRDQETGAITGLTPSRTVSGQKLLVSDDICDGGATFVKVAELLPGNKLDLYVTHGVFSGDAVDRLTTAGYRQIHTTNSFVQHDQAREEAIRTRCEVTNVWKQPHG